MSYTEHIINAQQLDAYSCLNTIFKLRQWRPMAITAHGLNNEPLWIAQLRLPDGAEFQGTDAVLSEAFRCAMAKAEEHTQRPAPVEMEDLL
jgi:hypothetical protein